MSRSRDQQAQGREGEQQAAWGRPADPAQSATGAEEALDPYLQDTYAQDPYGVDPYRSADSDPYAPAPYPADSAYPAGNPYSAAVPEETPQGDRQRQAYDVPPQQAGGYFTPGQPSAVTPFAAAGFPAEQSAEPFEPDRQAPSQQAQSPQVQPQQAQSPQPPSQRYADDPAPYGWAPGDPGATVHLQPGHSPDGPAAPAESAPTEYLGQGGHFGAAQQPGTPPPFAQTQQPPAPSPAEHWRNAVEGRPGENWPGADGVPLIEYDPPLSEQEIGGFRSEPVRPASFGPADPRSAGFGPAGFGPPPAAFGPAGAHAAPVGSPQPTAAAEAPAATAVPAAEPPKGGGGKVSNVLNSSAIMAAGTLVSRGTGFLRTMVIVYAIGIAGGGLGDSYNASNTLPTLLYILIGGGALNAVFVPQLVRAMKNDKDGGTAYANRLLTLVMVGLAGLTIAAVLLAPTLVQLISHPLMKDPASASATVTLARYCLPTIFFMGIHVVMGQVLNARGRFGAMMWTPVLNNVVVIFTFVMYLWVFGTWGSSRVDQSTVTPEGLRLLGLGTLLGLVVQALAMIPYLRAAGFHYRPRFDWRGHGLGKAARLAKWTFLFVLVNQAGYLVITQLATAAGRDAAKAGLDGGGLAAFSNAMLIWQLPHAVLTVSVMSAVLPRLSRAADDHDTGAVRDDLSYGLRTTAVAIIPAAFLFLALGPSIGSTIYGSGNIQIGIILSAFALGLIPYSAQYILLRAFYAYEDTRTPFANTVWVAVTQAAFTVLCYLLLPTQWAVTGMALGYGFSYLVGVLVAVPKLKRKIGGLDTKRVLQTYAKLAIACVPAALVGFGVQFLVTGAVHGWVGSVLAVVVAGVLQMGLFVVIANRMRIEELTAMIGMVRGRLGR